MESSVFVICARIGRQMKFEFEGTLLNFDAEESVFTFGEVTDNGIQKKDGDVIVLDLKKRAVALTSQHFYMVLDVLGNKNVGSNYYFKCATDICRVDVYVCEKSLWRDRGETIFS